MSGEQMIISAEKYQAVLFDLDGVLTLTMKIHAAAWKQMFDRYLQQRSSRFGELHRPFDIATDYKAYVDGRLRYDGVRSFLASRSITLPQGHPDDNPEEETICGLGNRKNCLFQTIVSSEGVELLEGSLAAVQKVRSLGLKTAVVSASKNCETILRAANIDALFDCIVDGNVAARLGLPGKPAPDTFLTAAEILNVQPRQAVVVEDAISGVQAGRAGGFGLVIGIDHHDDRRTLKENGADIVVKRLDEIIESE